VTSDDHTAPESAPCAGATRASVVAVVLAAGAGSRFRGTRHKLLAPLPADEPGAPRTVVERAVFHALAADIGPVVVVWGAVELPLPPGVTAVRNDEWERGQITSLQRGLEAADDLGCDRAVVGLGDQPGIAPSAWRAVAAADGPIAVATYAARRGNPVALDRTIWGLLPTSGDEGARVLMRSRPDLVREVPCSGSAADIDTLEDLREWQNN
jgi:molybdenum cofactor cytidylyltransferase